MQLASDVPAEQIHPIPAMGTGAAGFMMRAFFV
jgi:hypothetical protein